MRTYLDTSGWSALCDANVSRRRLAGTDILFSACNLDEIGLASFHRARELAKVMWSFSNRQKLLDHVELTAGELHAHEDGISLVEIYDKGDSALFEAWRAIRTAGLTDKMLAEMRARSDYAKQAYRDWLRVLRERFARWFGPLQADELPEAWAGLLAELEAEGYITEMLDGVLRMEGFGGFPHDVPYRALPATACWVQYYVALGFLAGHASRKLARPDLGDQVDYRHACYAGLADFFVSGDDRMRYVLNEMVIDKRATVLSTAEFLDTLPNRE